VPVFFHPVVENKKTPKRIPIGALQYAEIKPGVFLFIAHYI
jgi:hypothetical protein